MKFHFFLYAFQSTIIDLDKKIPLIKRLFPNSAIEKKEYANTDCIIVKDIIESVKLKSFNANNIELRLFNVNQCKKY